MEPSKRQQEQERKGQKRKLEEDDDDEREISYPSEDAHRVLLCEVSTQVTILNTTCSWSEADRATAKRATHALAELAKNGTSVYSDLLLTVYSLCCLLPFPWFLFFLFLRL